MCGALGVQCAGRQEIKEGWQMWAGRRAERWKTCVCPVQGGESNHSGAEGWSRAKGYLAHLLKGRLEVIGDTHPLTHISRYTLSIHLSYLLISHQTLWNLCKIIFLQTESHLSLCHIYSWSMTALRSIRSHPSHSAPLPHPSLPQCSGVSLRCVLVHTNTQTHTHSWQQQQRRPWVAGGESHSREALILGEGWQKWHPQW